MSARPPVSFAGPLLEACGLVKEFPGARGTLRRGRSAPVRAVDGVSFAAMPGEALGLVGETGCGKTTTARLLMGLLEPSAGAVRLDGRDVGRPRGGRRKALAREMQMIFQDPYSSLNPRRTVAAIVAEPFAIHGLQRDRAGRRRRVRELLEMVGMSGEHRDRYPHELSGGQRQRVGIARALALEPRVLIADEPVSALDVSVQAQVLNLLRDLQERLGLTLLFISHDLSVIRYMCDRVAVMRAGRIVELATNAQLYGSPRDPYTRELLASVPGMRGDRRTIHG